MLPGAVFAGFVLGAFVSGVVGGVGFGEVFCGLELFGDVSGVGLVGVASGVGLVGVASGVGLVGVVSGVGLVGAAVPGVGAAVPGVGAAVPGVGAAVPDGFWFVLGCDVLGVCDRAGAVLCPAGLAAGAAVWLKLWTVKKQKNAASTSITNNQVILGVMIDFSVIGLLAPYGQTKPRGIR